MKIRNAEVKDAQNFLNMLKKLDTETKNMMFEPGERNAKLEKIEARIKNTSGENGLLLLIDDNNKIGGFLSAERGWCKRIRHVAYIVVGMLTEYRGKHLGTNMFKELEKWAISNNIIRLELSVVCTNESALALYKKMGFKIEGTKEKAMIVDGNYVDEYYMGKIINKN
ncbi:MAG: GNAT family N-acetyltransferase [Clostridium butyricum]|nr:GNAT family N-acetyltransferase [Clostridium butyricum]